MCGLVGNQVSSYLTPYWAPMSAVSEHAPKAPVRTGAVTGSRI
jgi:hypothetical protein